MLELLDKLCRIVEEISTREQVFADVRIEVISSFFIERNLETTCVREGVDIDATVRVFSNGVWEFTSTIDLSPDSIRKALETALKMTHIRKSELKIRLLDPKEDHVRPVLKRDFRNIDPEIKLRDVEEYFRILTTPSYVKSC